MRNFIAMTDSMLCWKFPSLARWQIEQINITDGTRLDVDSMRFRSARSAAVGITWANQRLPASARPVLTYRIRPIKWKADDVDNEHTRPRPSGIRAVIDGRTYELDDTLRYEGVAPGPDPRTGKTVELEIWTIELPDLRGQVEKIKFGMHVGYLPAKTGLQFRGWQPRRLS